MFLLSFELFFLKIEMRSKSEFVELFVLQSNDVDSDAMDGNVRKRKRHDEHSFLKKCRGKYLSCKVN